MMLFIICLPNICISDIETDKQFIIFIYAEQRCLFIWVLFIHLTMKLNGLFYYSD